MTVNICRVFLILTNNLLQLLMEVLLLIIVVFDMAWYSVS